MIPDNIYQIARNEASRNSIDLAVLLALIDSESGFNTNAFGSSGEVGLMQLKLATAREMAGNPNLSVVEIQDPPLNIELGARYFAKMLAQTGGDIYKALAKYKGAVTNFSGVDNAYNKIPQYQALVAQKEQQQPYTAASLVPENITKSSLFMPIMLVLGGIFLFTMLRSK